MINKQNDCLFFSLSFCYFSYQVGSVTSDSKLSTIKKYPPVRLRNFEKNNNKMEKRGLDCCRLPLKSHEHHLPFKQNGGTKLEALRCACTTSVTSRSILNFHWSIFLDSENIDVVRIFLLLSSPLFFPLHLSSTLSSFQNLGSSFPILKRKKKLKSMVASR